MDVSASPKAPTTPSMGGTAPQAPGLDSLQLPLPPIDLIFSTSPNGSTTQRYQRAGDAFDARKAVVGKGGFGTVYRFERDDTHGLASPVSEISPDTSPLTMTSMLPPTVSGDDSPATSHSTGSAAPLSRSYSTPSSKPRGTEELFRSTTDSRPVPFRPVPPKPSGPAVIIVKVCRTPSSGAFDEMPKTGAGRAAAKAADQAIDTGDTSGFHTRIVRGEARLFRFLQVVARREGRSNARTGVTRLLADLPLATNPEDGTTVVDDSGINTEEQTGPIPRLLIFERLVDLDAILTPKGWVKRRRQWTHLEVEQVARDVSLGLSFLHANFIVHGDLKPSNIMRDAKTGAAKLIDLGASRRFVCVPNLYKDSTTAVEEFDQFLADGSVPPQNASMVYTEGLGSLTGSPYFMAPEVLLQAGRYLDANNISRSVLHDYVHCRHILPLGTDGPLFDLAFSDFKRGWGIKSDIWSWACSVMALLLRLLPPEQKRSSSTICPFDFSFDNLDDAIEPRHRLHRGDRNLPRFHEWARRYPLRIVKVTHSPPRLPPEAEGLSAPALEMLQMSLSHMDSRPTANAIYKALTMSTRSTPMDMASSLLSTSRSDRRRSLTPSIQSETDGSVSHANSAHNVDLRASPAPGQTPSMGTPRASYSNCSALRPFGGGNRGSESESHLLAVQDPVHMGRTGSSPVASSPMSGASQVGTASRSPDGDVEMEDGTGMAPERQEAESMTDPPTPTFSPMSNAATPAREGSADHESHHHLTLSTAAANPRAPKGSFGSRQPASPATVGGGPPRAESGGIQQQDGHSTARSRRSVTLSSVGSSAGLLERTRTKFMAMLPGRSTNPFEPLHFEEVTASAYGRGEPASNAMDESSGPSEVQGSEQTRRRLENRRSLLTLPKLGKSRSGSLSSGALSPRSEEPHTPASERAQIVADGPNGPRRQTSKSRLRNHRKSMHFPRNAEGQAVPVPSLNGKGAQNGDPGLGHEGGTGRGSVSETTSMQHETAPTSERESFYSAQAAPQHDTDAPGSSLGDHAAKFETLQARTLTGRSERSGGKKRRASVMGLERLWPFGQGREEGEVDRVK